VNSQDRGTVLALRKVRLHKTASGTSYPKRFSAKSNIAPLYAPPVFAAQNRHQLSLKRSKIALSAIVLRGKLFALCSK
jgi:hypothetical protein